MCVCVCVCVLTLCVCVRVRVHAVAAEADAPVRDPQLRTRAKAYEAQGLYKQALADAQAVNKTDAANAESRDLERRVKELMASRGRPASASASNPFHLTIKATLGAESKLIYSSLTVSYADLLAQVRSKFPSAGAQRPQAEAAGWGRGLGRAGFKVGQAGE